MSVITDSMRLAGGLLVLVVAACEPPTAPVFNNPYDPDFVHGSPLPTPPGYPTLATSTSTSVTLAWGDSSSFEAGYAIERRDDQGRAPAFVELAQVGPNVTTYTDTAVELSRRYQYRVRTLTDDQESEYSDTLAVQYTGVRTRDLSISMGRLEFSPDGAFLAVDGSQEGVLYHAHTLRRIRKLGPYRSSLSRDVMAFSRDGTYLVRGDRGRMHLWRSQDGALVRRLDYPDDNLQSHVLAIAPDGHRIVYTWGPERGPIEWRVWDWQNEQVHTLPVQYEGEILALTFSPDAHTLIGYNRDHIVYLDAETGRLNRLVPFSTPTDQGTFSPDGHWLAVSGSNEARIDVWNLDIASRHRIIRLEGGTRGLSQIKFASDGETLLFYNTEHGAIDTYLVSSGRLLHRIEGRVGWRLLAGSHRNVAFANGYTLHVWDLEGSWEKIDLPLPQTSFALQRKVVPTGK